MSTPLLSVQDLSIAFKFSNNKQLPVVSNISFDIAKKETFALVGESGSGKSVTALSILNLLGKEQVSYPSGDILFENRSLLRCDEADLRMVRGNQISMIFQDPMVSLNPLHTIEKQLYEVLSLHRGMDRSAARREIIHYLDRVGIKESKKRLSSYPYQLSGGERQRVMIAMAILTEPKLLIADEPTTALDVSVQAQIIQLLRELKHELNMSMLFISHNLNVVKKLADNIAVIHQGKIVEKNSRHRIFLRPEHEYTKMLLDAVPAGEPVALFSLLEQPDSKNQILDIKNLTVDVTVKKGLFTRQKKRLIDNVSFSIRQGETVGIVGESGSGKSTTALAILRLIESQGEISYNNQPLQNLTRKQLMPFRRRIQVIFQDPYSSLNPKFNVEQIISEGLLTHKKISKQEQEALVCAIMQEVGLDPSLRFRYPMAFSGGERQRIAIARALILQPELLILDEPTSSLDRTIQLQIITLLKSLQEKYQLSYLFISHDLSLVYTFCHRVLVMQEGKIEEQGTRKEIFHAAKQDYTKMLLSFLDKPIKANKRPPLAHDNDKAINQEMAASQHKKPIKIEWEDALLIPRK